MIFHIDPDSGAITLGKILDRETAGWHNITVRAIEAGTLSSKLKVITPDMHFFVQQGSCSEASDTIYHLGCSSPWQHV